MRKVEKDKQKHFEWRDIIAGMSLALSFAIVVGNGLFFAVIKFNDFAHLEVNVKDIKNDVKEFREDISKDVSEIRTDIVELKEDVAQIKGNIQNKKR